jgi:hypothetical protein
LTLRLAGNIEFAGLDGNALLCSERDVIRLHPILSNCIRWSLSMPNNYYDPDQGLDCYNCGWYTPEDIVSVERLCKRLLTANTWLEKILNPVPLEKQNKQHAVSKWQPKR